MGLTPNQRLPVPINPATVANMNAPRFPIRPRTIGRLRVRVILASYSGSSIMLRALAEAAHNAVPVVKKTRVRVDNDGEIVVGGSRSAGTG